MTKEEIHTDYYAHLYFDNPKADEVEDEDFDLDEISRAMESDDWETVINMNGGTT